MEEGGASSSGLPCTPAKRPVSALQALHSVNPVVKRPRNRPNLSVEEQVSQAISDNIPHYTPLQLDSYLVDGDDCKVAERRE
eukprot:5077189-Amphidinium_carterae.1